MGIGHIVALQRATECVEPHARVVAAPVRYTAVPNGIRIVGQQRIADLAQSARGIVPDLAVDDVDNIYFGQVEPFCVRLGSAFDASVRRKKPSKLSGARPAPRRAPVVAQCPQTGRVIQR